MTATLTVMVGGGGVGKTTTGAALGLALARRGARVLVVTVDPARRLADALGVELGSETVRVEIDGIEFDAQMPDPRRAVGQFAGWLFAEDAARGQRIRQNSLYRELSDALVGMHEMMCVTLVDQELGSGRYDHVVLDTAPSRHALDFVDYPARLVAMLEARTLRWVGQLAAHAGASLARRPEGRGLLAWGKRRIAGLVANLVGGPAVHDLAAFFGDLAAVRGRWLGLLRSVERRLSAEHTRFWVVTGPSGAAMDDAEYLIRELERRELVTDRVLINRVQKDVPDWLTALGQAPASPLGGLVRSYLTEYEARALQTRRTQERMVRLVPPGTPLSLLPALRTTDPRTILRALSGELDAAEGHGWTGRPDRL
jgi:anion-transporting  ArsA/GET3 family ATPase